MMEADVHYLHQLAQVKEDAVYFYYKSHYSVSYELTVCNTVRQATQHLHSTYTDKMIIIILRKFADLPDVQNSM